MKTAKQTAKKLITSLLALAMPALIALPAFADDADANADCVDTAILNGCGGIEGILELVVRVMTIGIGILGVIGITVAGIQYITAGGNEEQTRKAKRRLFEIVIGLAVYVVLYAALYWLVPDFHPFQWGN